MTMPTNGEKNERFESLQDEDNKMRSLSDLADDYERWAAEYDAIVLRMMSDANQLAEGVRHEQLLQAARIAQEARNLRDHAKGLRRTVVQQSPNLKLSAS